MPLTSITIATKQLTLKGTTPADLDELLGLWNDGRVMRWAMFPEGLGYDRAKMERWLSRIAESPDRFHFIARTRDGAFCGEVYAALDRAKGRASLDIKFTPAKQGGRRSREALNALIRWLFESFPEIDAVWTGPIEGNLAAHTLYYSCGMRPKDPPADLPHGPSYWERRRGPAPYSP
jgi:RimJ/RimL family protein N-acetyltransferase